ncbi:acetyltransferase [Paenibacillus terrae]|uniref:Acetyltransferase (The isoleucine patch superfamily) protein n=1 Tax=Paenibacillus terrae (strain HPL-003) TaxID=985665 RepID=G7W323_PAETH|nr:acetyltransferase [Paenibacillus terrae]AET60679.1 acetyltransferase (the isoleucine patch superfamily) protein [Paenibacillus terrae HPL-003]
MKKIVIWGSGGHAREINWLCEELGVQVVGFLDERPEMKGHVVDGVPVLGTLADIEVLKHEVELLCAGVGDPALKKRFVYNTIRSGFRIASSLIHPHVRLSQRNIIGEGSMIFEGSVLSDNIKIGNHVIINRSVTISHDAVIGDYVTISPGVNLAGNVTINDGAYIGIGASVREKRHIGCWSMIGGGAFVKDDIPEFTMAAGVPAVVKKRLADG